MVVGGQHTVCLYAVLTPSTKPTTGKPVCGCRVIKYILDIRLRLRSRQKIMLYMEDYKTEAKFLPIAFLFLSGETLKSR